MSVRRRTTLAGPRRDQSQAEEIANSASHGVGLVAALLGTPFLIGHALRNGSAGFVAGVGLFSATVIYLYLASTLYHAWPRGKAKRFLRVIDHSAIFLLIAGTYTPVTLGVLRGAWGWTLLGVVWSLAAAGVALKAFGNTARPILSTGLYLLMGWVVVVAADSRLPYGHLIWHLFVLAGTGCHFIALLWCAA